MKELINFLELIEQNAQRLYCRCADLFKDNQQLNIFFQSLAEDEAQHRRLIRHAFDTVSEKVDTLMPEVILDDITRTKIISLYNECDELLALPKPDQTLLLKSIIRFELSEWNDYFTYTVNFLQQMLPSFSYTASSIQKHINRILHFLKNIHEVDHELVAMLEGLPRIWQNRLLVVDDDPVLRRLLAALFSRDFWTDTATDGNAGLHMVEASYYDVILSDIDMPGLNGIDFYKMVKERSPDQARAFVFLSGNDDEDREQYIKSEGIPLLRKPFNINDIKTSILQFANVLTE